MDYENFYYKEALEGAKKKYNEALERAKKLQETCDNPSVVGWCEYIFPQLRESEDERIRKAIHIYLDWLDGRKDYAPKGEYSIKDMIAWLEKHSEQKPFDYENATIQQTDFAPKSAMETTKEEKVDNAIKVEPKFKVDDWITHNIANFVFKVINVGSNGYEVVNRENYKKTISFDNEDNYHLWTIQDAKDGDVLVHNDCTFIFMGIKDGIVQAIEENMLELIPFGEPDKDKNYYPATKEQRNTLMKAMADAGWKFDFEKKELKKISNALEECEIEHIEHGKYYYCIKDYYSGGCKRASKGEVVQALRGMGMMALGVKANEYFIPVKCIIDNKPAWSEEDEKKLEM